MNKNITCSKCKKDITPMDCFPDGLCPDCYYKIMDQKTLNEIKKPNFKMTVSDIVIPIDN